MASDRWNKYGIPITLLFYGAAIFYWGGKLEARVTDAQDNNRNQWVQINSLKENYQDIAVSVAEMKGATKSMEKSVNRLVDNIISRKE